MLVRVSRSESPHEPDREAAREAPREAATPAGRTRRAPPRFRRAAVRLIERMSPRRVRVHLAGPELVGLAVEQPASSVRLLLPLPGTGELVIPEWTGNEFLLPDGTRPPIRTFTPRRADPTAGTLDLEIVVHGPGVASGWAARAAPGDPVAVSGPARGYTVDPEAAAFVLAGDETAVAAIAELLGALPCDAPVRVHLEVANPAARVALPDHPRAQVRWHDLPPGAPPGDTLVRALHDEDLTGGTRVWAAGEAAAMQRIRRHLFQERGIPRAHTSVRGYWKHGRAGEAEE